MAQRLQVLIPSDCDGGQGDHCTVCLREELASTPGVKHVELVDRPGDPRSIAIELDESVFDLRQVRQRHAGQCKLIDAIARAQAARPSFHRLVWAWLTANHEIALVLLGGVLLTLGWLVGLAAGPVWLRLTLLAGSVILSSLHTFPDAVRSLASFKLDVDVLMFAAAIGASAIGHYEEGALLLFLFGLGHAGEDLAMGRARRAIESLTQLAPETAIRLDDAGESPVKIDMLVPGDRVLIRPFDRVPVDAVVIEGSTEVDQSALTGESTPVSREPGDGLLAGSLNGSGRVVVRVERVSSESTLARIVKLVEEAQSQKGRVQRFTDRVEAYYVPAVFVVTLLLIMIPPALGITPRQTTSLWGGWFYQAMAFLTAASPCALAIGTPAAMLCGVARAARIGVIIKGGAHLESLASIRAIALDKTGTLTAGKPVVEHVVTVDGVSDIQALAWAAAVETHSSHPLAGAIVTAAKARGVLIDDAAEVVQTPGVGIVGRVDGSMVGVGKSSLAGDPETWPESLRRSKRVMEEAGSTVVTVAREGRLAALLGMVDQPRASARESIARLRQAGVEHVVMLTGDHAASARLVAQRVGLEELHADLLPEQKLTLIDDLMRRYGPTAMLGDGVNDAPALARATVGIAMGAAGTAVAVETADVVLMGHDLRRVADAIEIAQRARSIVRQNLVIALGVIAFIAPAAAMGLAPLGVAVLLHEGSTVVVVLNALRLLRR
jgi:Cd2+/Zn2+-exporting ATPase